MLQGPVHPEFTCLGAANAELLRMDAATGMGQGRPHPGSCGRPRSSSLNNIEDSSHYLGDNEADRSHIRPRSRSFYTFEIADDDEDRHFTRSNAMRPRTKSLLQNQDERREKAGENIMVKPLSKRLKSASKNPSKDFTGSRGSLKNVPMMTITEADNWEISACSGMNYGQYVDWEKIDPEAAKRYQNILECDHNELKVMGRSGFWATPHTLRAKAYNHIVSDISSKAAISTDVYPRLAGQLFGEHTTSTHPFPRFMEDGEIPRYCLNKAGLNSVKKILICVSDHSPDISFCPILPALVSLLLHFSEDEAKCFHSICSLVAYNDPNKRYIDQTFITYRSSCMTFGDLANKYCRGIRKLIASSHQNLFEFYSDWIMWIFADLPFTYAIRVLDVYLLEGYKVLYRVALALLSLYKVSVSSRLPRVDDFRQDMKSFVQNVARHSTIEGLLRRAFAIRLATRRELNFLFNANKNALMHKGMHQKSSYQSLDLGNFNSSVVTETEMRVVWAWIPERFALFNPVLLFSTTDHGRSLTSFYSHLEGHEPMVLLLKTSNEEVCGAFLSSDWNQRKRNEAGLVFFGTGECFVFTLLPGMERYQRTVLYISGVLDKNHRSPQPVTNSLSSCGKHPSLGTPDSSCLNASFTTMFMAGDDDMVVIGGDRGHALTFQRDLSWGRTESCDTFESPPLCKGLFKIQALEVWGIKDSLSLLQA